MGSQECIYNDSTMLWIKRLNKVKVLSFDGDMTLWDFQSAMKQALSYTLEALRNQYPGPATTALSVETLIAIRNRTAVHLKASTNNLEEIRYHALRNTLQHIGIDNDAFAYLLYELYLKHRFEDIQLYPDVQPALVTLKHKYVLCLCSNGNSYPGRCGLPNIFDFSIFAQDVGVEKPDIRMFQEVYRQTHCTPEALLHIGDSLTSDVYGAQKAGAIAAWLNRNCILNDTDIRPDIELHSLSDLVEILNVTP
jgi:HAD superfamily hydrolase (TIGR01509 family)